MTIRKFASRVSTLEKKREEKHGSIWHQYHYRDMCPAPYNHLVVSTLHVKLDRSTQCDSKCKYTAVVHFSVMIVVVKFTIFREVPQVFDTVSSGQGYVGVSPVYVNVVFYVKIYLIYILILWLCFLGWHRHIACSPILLTYIVFFVYYTYISDTTSGRFHYGTIKSPIVIRLPYKIWNWNISETLRLRQKKSEIWTRRVKFLKIGRYNPRWLTKNKNGTYVKKTMLKYTQTR